MRDERFDDIIKKKLETYEADISSMDWDRFKDNWDLDSDLDAHEQQFDDIIKDNLEEVTIPYDENHWIKFRERIITNREIRKKILAMKSMEMLIATFTLILLSNFFNLNGLDLYRPSEVPLASNSELEKPSDDSLGDDNLFSPEKIVNPSMTNDSSKEDKSQDTNDLQSLDNLSYSITEQSIANEHSEVSNAIEKNHLNQAPLYADLKKDRNHIGKNLVSSEDTYEDEKINTQDQIDVKHIPSYMNELSFERSFSVAQPLSIRDSRFYAGVSAGLGYQIISSPLDPIYGLDKQVNTTGSYQVGLIFGRDFNRFHLSTGLQYGSFSYTPPKIEELLDVGRSSNQYVQSLSKNTYRIASIPLEVGLHLIERGNHQLYTLIGGAANVLVSADYYVEIYDYDTNNTASIASRPVSYSNLDRKNFDNGLLRSGKLTNNFFLTASVGLGYGYSIRDNVRLFGEFRYSRHLISDGIGPNKDRLSSNMLSLGLTKGI